MARRRFGSVLYDRRRRGWYIQFRHGGRQRRRKVASRDDADRVLTMIEGLVLQRRSLEEILHEVFGERPKSMMSFLEAAGLYLEHSEAIRRRSTHRNNVYRLRAICRAPWAGWDLAGIPTADLEQWATRRRRKVSNATVNRDLSIISVVFKWANRLGYVQGNPVARVERPGEERRPRTLWLRQSECHALLRAAPVEFRTVLLCALHAGLRRAELWNLEWRSVSLSRKELIVEPEDNKSAKPRKITMSCDLEREVRALRVRRSEVQLGDHQAVFLRPNGTRWGKSSFRQALKRVRIAAKDIETERCRKITLHVLRHTFASHLAQQGVSFQKIAQLLGHGTTRVTERYAHMAPDSEAQAIRCLERVLKMDAADIIQEALPAPGGTSEDGAPVRQWCAATADHGASVCR